MLIVHRASSGTALVAALADVLRAAPADPFAADVVAVPAKGVERWIAQRLSHRLGAGAQAGDGVCANVRFPWPGSLLDEALQAASPEHESSVEAWAAQRSMWTILEVIDGSAGTEPWCATLAQHLGVNGVDKGRRLSVASRLARLFDEYGQSRPSMLQAWARGADEDGDGRVLSADLHWEAELWRRVRDELGTPSPAELLEPACERLRAEPTVTALPERLSVFGASRLSPARLAVLAALAEHRDVHLWLHHASPALWRTIGRHVPAVRRRDDHSRSALSNPLLTSLSRDVRELQQLLTRTAPDFTDVLHEAPALPETLLGQLKADLANDAVQPQPRILRSDDRSVQVHSCHGRTRQVEVLREVVLGLLADDPTLEPRDVLVMCPDVETFAPIIAATFSLGDEESAHPAARLRVRLADRSLRQTNALLAVLSELLELGLSRITASQVLDLAGNPAVRQRFGFGGDEIERLRDWVAQSGVRWGLDTEHRRTWHLDKVGQGTWRSGIDRLLLGVAMEEHPGELAESAPGDVVPLDDVDSADIELAGRFAELVDRLDSAQALMSGRHPLAVWIAALEKHVLALAAVPRDAAWQELQLHSELADLAESGEGSQSLLSLADVRALLEQTMRGRPTRASFRTGTLTVCTLVPMRSVPHRVLCLLGLDDGVFPRQSIRDGDDVLTRDPWVGERDPRSEDRQLLLDAVSAAEEHLVITYAGADARTGAPIPPAVPLGELLDALDRTAGTPDGRPLREVITTRHPLQPFDARNFTEGALEVPGPFSFDPIAYAGARAAAGGRTPPEAFLPGPLAASAVSDVELGSLIALLQHPARGFLRQRLQVAITRDEDEPDDTLPVELDSLEQWSLGDRLLRLRLAGVDPATCMALEIRRGTLPPGPLGVAQVRDVGREAELIFAATAQQRELPAEAYDVDVALADGTHVVGTVGDARGDVLLSMTYSRLGPKQRLRAWVELVALSATDPMRQWQALTVGRGRGAVNGSWFGPLTASAARAALDELVELYRSGLRAPLPMPLKTAAAYATQRRRGRDVEAALGEAESAWNDRRWKDQNIPGEGSDAEHVLLHGAGSGLATLTAERPWPAEQGAGWPEGEDDRFGVLAQRLWGRLLAAERGA